MPKPIVLTIHARDAVEERELKPEWLERAAREPAWIAADPNRVGVDRRYRPIPEHGDRVLRVACYETPDEIRILTAFFDRNARRPP